MGYMEGSETEKDIRNGGITLYGPCPDCGLVASATDSRPNDGGGTWNCLRCGFQYGIWLDGGELDLGLIPHDHVDLGAMPDLGGKKWAEEFGRAKEEDLLNQIRIRRISEAPE